MKRQKKGRRKRVIRRATRRTTGCKRPALRRRKQGIINKQYKKKGRDRNVRRKLPKARTYHSLFSPYCGVDEHIPINRKLWDRISRLVPAHYSIPDETIVRRLSQLG